MENFGFVIINPWSVKWAEALLLKIDQNEGLERIATIPIVASRKALEIQYAHKLKDRYGPWLIDSIADKDIVLATYVGGETLYQDIVKTKEKIRVQYNWRITQPDQIQYPGLKNVAMHSSSNRVEATRELEPWADHVFATKGFDLRERIKSKLTSR